MIGKLKNTITVQQLYNYAVLHNYLNADVTIVLDIINRESSKSEIRHDINGESLINPINNTNTIDFNTLVEYTTNDVLALFNT